MGACSVESRHNTLTFFFDGVDESANKKANPADNISKSDKPVLASTASTTTNSNSEASIHKPYLERKCEACHAADKKLLMPVPGLCFKCHTDFRISQVYTHGPVASGNCTKCHNQHLSQYPKLLIRQGQQLCTTCHAPAELFRNKNHINIEDAACVKCHNAHGGDAKFFLKENIADKLNGSDALGIQHLYARFYNKDSTGINTDDIKIIITNSEGDIVSTCSSDKSGYYELQNLHPDDDYIFKLSRYAPVTKIFIESKNKDLLYTIEKKNNKHFVFDRSAYEKTHLAMSGTVQHNN